MSKLVSKIHQLSNVINGCFSQVSDVLHRHAKPETFETSFNYRSVIGKINYLDRGN